MRRIDPRALIRKSPIPVLVLLALALATITVVSPAPRSGKERDDVASTAIPPARKHLVPARTTTGEPPAGPGDKVALRQLIIATTPDDFALPGWKAVLDRIGTPYDVLFARTEPVRASRFVRPDGVGRYNAILLTDNALLTREGGEYRSALDDSEWRELWHYERAFGVRQVALNTAPGTAPEDYCLRSRAEGEVRADPVPVALTGAGAGVFDYLKPAARLPLTHSYLYRTRLAPDCAAQPILTHERDVLGVLSTAPDGRERVALTFVPGADQPSADLLGFGLLRWATRGIFLGERRHWLNVDVDDWFNATLRRHPDGTTGMFRLSGPDAAAADRQQTELRGRHPMAGDFTLNLPYNGSGLDPRAPARCDEAATPDPLTSYSRCLIDRFRWINHTLTHPQLNFTSYEENRAEIAANLSAAASIGLPVPPAVLKTPEYSGLGVYHPVPNALGDPTDHGLTGSNRNLLRAAADLGVKYLHGNMSFASHRPGCFNCGIHHPAQPDVLVVPDWPTSIAFEATTPDEQTALYNAAYGRDGTAKDHGDHDLAYPEIVDSEAEVALGHLISGSAYAHTLHQGNLHEYAPGRSLTFDWLEALLTKYDALFQTPLKNPDWSTLTEYVRARTEHFTELARESDAVWNRRTNAVTYTPATDGTVFLTGLVTQTATEEDQQGPDQAEVYGTDAVSQLGLHHGETVTVTARPRR
ncbi:hypothetical protein [Amycolatopsis anabasis]|uniref:Agd3-related carbohydrate-binding protein n=1 Tax=Amycolatopsis anabasis TaxID=1840409 RepID=UPI00131B60A9|nr:hypothetical protein [Amycolatopsis anabasis]